MVGVATVRGPFPAPLHPLLRATSRSLLAQMVKNLPAVQDALWVGEIPWRREW